MGLQFPMDMNMIYQNQMLQQQPLLINDSMHHHGTTNNSSMGLDETNNTSQLNQQMQINQMNNDGSDSSTSNEENVCLRTTSLFIDFSLSQLLSRIFILAKMELNSTATLTTN
jgi:hypothetical protein